MESAVSQQTLIEITERGVGTETVQTVNARDLHAFLGIGKDFSNWIKAQLERARLVENRDFIKVAQKGELSGQTRIDYFLTIEAAKHIAMMSGSEKGFEVREYFIECERRVKHNAPAIDLNDPAFLRTMLLGYTEKVLELQAKVAADAPKVEFHDKYAVADGCKGVREVAKLVGAKQNEFVAFLLAHGVMYRLHGSLAPIAHHQHAGRFIVKTGVSNNEHAFNQTMFTPKGVTWIAAEWAKYKSAVAA
jgi:anti-repressor protein